MFGCVCVFKPDQLNRELWFNGLIIVYFYIYLQVLAHTSTHSREHACYSQCVACPVFFFLHSIFLLFVFRWACSFAYFICDIPLFAYYLFFFAPFYFYSHCNFYSICVLKRIVLYLLFVYVCACVCCFSCAWQSVTLIKSFSYYNVCKVMTFNESLHTAVVCLCYYSCCCV